MDATRHPGQNNICRTCQHYDASMHGQGHPSPCSCVRWIGANHVKPELRVVAGKVDCSDKVTRQAATEVECIISPKGETDPLPEGWCREIARLEEVTG